jgi:hypothetical protein
VVGGPVPAVHAAAAGWATTLLLKLAAAGSLVLLGLSVYPGVLFDLVFVAALISPIWFPALVIGGIIFLVIQSRSTKKPPISPDLDLIVDEVGGGKEIVHPRRRIATTPAIIALSLVLIWFGIPRRVAFLLSRPAFERHIATAPANRYGGEPLRHRLGVYDVDRYATDPRGGIYFRTHAGPDGIGPDTMSYGFAFRPNREGTPFGKAGYGLSHMVGDWYCFSASNDN